MSDDLSERMQARSAEAGVPGILSVGHAVEVAESYAAEQTAAETKRWQAAWDDDALANAIDELRARVDSLLAVIAEQDDRLALLLPVVEAAQCLVAAIDRITISQTSDPQRVEVWMADLEDLRTVRLEVGAAIRVAIEGTET